MPPVIVLALLTYTIRLLLTGWLQHVLLVYNMICCRLCDTHPYLQDFRQVDVLKGDS